MRFQIALIAVCASVCSAQPAEAGVLSVYRQMEKAEQTGNGEAWMALFSSKSDTAAHPEMKNYIRARSSIRYTSTKILVDGDRAALIGTMNDQFLSVTFVRENGVWKIVEPVFSNVAIDPAALYALVPPADGAFARAGSPWQSVEVAKAAEMKSRIQAVADEAYLYVRIEAAEVLPAQDSEVKGTFPDLKSGVPRDWPVMAIRVAGPPAREYLLHIGDAVGDQATFDEHGKANSHRYFVAYSMTVTRGEQTLFSASAREQPVPLITVHDRCIDVKLPLKALAARGKIEIADANIPGRLQIYEVKKFTR